MTIVVAIWIVESRTQGSHEPQNAEEKEDLFLPPPRCNDIRPLVSSGGGLQACVAFELLDEAFFDRWEHGSGWCGHCGGRGGRRLQGLQIIDLLEQVRREVVAVALPKLGKTPISAREHASARWSAALALPVAISGQMLDALAHGVVEGNFLTY